MTTFDEHREHHLSRICDQQRYQRLDVSMTRPSLADRLDVHARKVHRLTALGALVAAVVGVTALVAALGVASLPGAVIVAAVGWVPWALISGYLVDRAKFEVDGEKVAAMVRVPGPVAYAYTEATGALDRVTEAPAAVALRDDANRLVDLAADAHASAGRQSGAVRQIAAEMAEVAASACALAEVLANEQARPVLDEVRASGSRALAAEAAATFTRELGRA